MCDRVSPLTEANYPNLVASGYKKTSEIDPKYNCVSWVFADQSQWWESAGEPGMFWPDEVPKGIYVENFIRLFQHYGFSPCQDSTFEEGYEKIAIFKFDIGWFAHVAKLLESGKWTSKLGPDEDIEHVSLNALDGVDWQLHGFMRRKV